MEFHRIRYFLEVAQTGSFSKAAAHCNVSQPSLSQQILKLEAQVGEPLFKRLRQGAILTEFGEAFLPHARTIEQSMRNASEFASSYRQSIRGTIRMGAIPTVAPYLLPAILDCTSKRYRDIRFELHEETTAQLIQKLQSGVIDFALLSTPFEGEGSFENECLLEDELLVTLPATHPLNERDEVPVPLLESELMVLLKETHCLSEQSLAICQEAGAHPRVHLESNQLETALALVESGLGVTFTPRIALPFHRNRRVLFHSIAPRPVTRNIALAWAKTQSFSRAQSAFLEVIRECAAKSKHNL